MKSVWDIARRLGTLLMMVALLAMSVQAAVASTGIAGSDDCLSHGRAQHMAADDAAPSVEHQPDDRGHGDKFPCKSACCGSICPMAMPSLLSFDEAAAQRGELPGLPVSPKIKGVNLDGLSRPPKVFSAV